VIRRLIDQHLTEQATRLGFASLQTYLADRVTRQAWTLTQVASELGTDPETVRDRLDRCGLRRTRQTPCAAGWQPSGRPAQPGARQARRAARLAALGLGIYRDICGCGAWSRAGRFGACGSSCGWTRPGSGSR